MKAELVLNEEQKNQRFRSSFNLRCVSEGVSTDYRREETTSREDLLEGTGENISGTVNTDDSPVLSNLNVDPLPAGDIIQSFSYNDIPVEPIEPIGKEPESKTEPFVRVSVIQKNRQKPSFAPTSVDPEPLCLPDRNVLLQNEIDLVWHYIHKKFRRNREMELMLRFECECL